MEQNSQLPDGTAVFRTNRKNTRKLDYTTFYALKRITPDPDWEIAEIGVQIFTGRAYLCRSRQKSYGVFLGGEDEYLAISYERLQSETGLPVDEENFRRFVPQEKYDAWEEANKPEPPVKAPAALGIYNRKAPIAAYYVYGSRRFGADAAYFRRCGEYYRAFYIQNDEAGKTYLPVMAGSPPTEQEIDRILEDRFSSSAYDRLLKPEEAAWFFNQYTTRKSGDSELWSDIYGSNITFVTEVRDSGQVIRNRESTNFSSRMENCIMKLAMRGIEFEGPVPEELQQEPDVPTSDLLKSVEAFNDRLPQKEKNGKKRAKRRLIAQDIGLSVFALLFGMALLISGIIAVIKEGFSWGVILVWFYSAFCIVTAVKTLVSVAKKRK